MYKVYLDDELLYHPNLVKQNLSIEKTKLNVELNKTGSFTFVIRRTNPRYVHLKKMQSIVKVYDDNERLFRGRVLNSKRGLYNELQVTCEGELAFLLDSRVRPYEFTGSVNDYHRFLVEQHNAQVNPVKQFKVGICTVTDPNDYISRASSDYPNTWDEFNEKLIKLLGGYIWTREEEDGVYIDYLKDFDQVNDQAIEFGENLLSFEETIKGQDVATAIIPLGCKLTEVDEEGNEVETEERLTIADINNGLDYVCHEEAVKKYGLIFKVVEWEDVTIAENLKQKAEEELQNTIQLMRTLDLTAVDLHALKVNIKAFRLGHYTPVRSKPHDIDEYLLTRKLSINILNATDSSLLLGDEKPTFTDKHVEGKKETSLYIGKAVESNKDAMAKANNASRTATDHLRYSESGLCITDVIASILRKNINITKDRIEIRNGLEVLASFGESEILLGDSNAKVVMSSDSAENICVQLIATDGSNHAVVILRPTYLSVSPDAYFESNVYTKNGTIQASDRSEKENVIEMSESDVYSQLFDKLRPVQYSSVNGSGRIGYGLIAQDVIEALEELGIDEDNLDLVHHDLRDNEEAFGIAYTNLIAILIHEVQKLKAKIAESEQ